MRIPSLTIAVCLAFTLLVSAVPAPPRELTPTERICENECLRVQEECLLNSIEMKGCVDNYDFCRDACEVYLTPDAPDTPSPVQTSPEQHKPVNEQKPPAPGLSNNRKHKDVTHEMDIGQPGVVGPIEDEKKTVIQAPKQVDPLQRPPTPPQVDEEFFDDDFEEIPPPLGGEDDEEFNDEPSDY
ncbi:hypothetical protein BGX34_011738 [Mortierella sp. NVP85]|nr:hypothetical protein BGX34_011738 [Mortierella sp. NVP85]